MVKETWQTSADQRLFVYGSLRHGKVLERLIGQRYLSLGCGLINGRLFNIQDYPGVKLNTLPCYAIVGDILQLTDSSDWAIIDDYEGCADHCPSPFEFIRQQHSIINGAGRQLLAWVYSYQPNIDGLIEITGGDYLAYVDATTRDAVAGASIKP